MNAVVPAPLSAGDADARSHRVRRWLLAAALLGGLWVIAVLTQAGRANADPVTPSAGLGTTMVKAIAPAPAQPANAVNVPRVAAHIPATQPPVRAVTIPAALPAVTVPVPVPAPVQAVLTQVQPVLTQPLPVFTQAQPAVVQALLTPPTTAPTERSRFSAAHLTSGIHIAYGAVAVPVVNSAGTPVALSNAQSGDRNLPFPNDSHPFLPSSPMGNGEHSPQPATNPTDLPRSQANTTSNSADLDEAVPNISPADLPFSPD